MRFSDFELLKKIACLGLKTPLIFGGGINSVEYGLEVIQLGADRICVDAIIHDELEIVRKLSEYLGAQAVIGSLPLSINRNDINWLEKGFTSAKQELLCYWHGFYFDAHRAMNDVDAMIHLVTHNSYGDHRPLLELIEASKKPLYIIFAENFQYDPVKKDIVKGNKYRWNSKDKIWYKNVGLDELEREKEWLTVAIYDSVFKGRVEEINLNDKYKL